MYAKFRILLTVLVFVNVNLKALSASAGYEVKEINNEQSAAAPVVLETDGEEVETTSIRNTEVATTTTALEVLPKAKARSIADNSDDDDERNSNEAPQKQHKDTSRPLKNVFRSIYKSYKSTYMGNVTSAEYKKRLIERLSTGAHSHATSAKPTITTQHAELNEQLANERFKNGTSSPKVDHEETPLVPPALDAEALKANLKEKLRKRKRKYNRSHASAKRPKTNDRHSNTATADADKVNEPADSNNNTVNNITSNAMPIDNTSHTYNGTFSAKHNRYTIGPGVNMSFDMVNDIVNVNLDSDNLVEIMRGRWLNDNSEEGRGKKYDMITKVLPLFVLPFLIQSAIVPFLVTKLKLLLVKSILIGKLAIFLLILSAIKNNNNKSVQSYEVAPSYWAGEPSRRSELAAAASSSAYNGYRVEGKPAAWIN